MSVRDTGTGGETREKCRNCGGDAGDNHFDRSLCACGSMHHYCNGCGHALDDCSVSASGGPISDERETMKAMTGELADYAEEGGMSNVDADELRAQILGTYERSLAELSRLRALLNKQEEALRDVPVAYETKVLAALDHHLPGHSENCDEGWTSGACLRCEVMANVKVAFGFSRPLNAALSPPPVDLTLRCPTCGRRADVCFEHGDDWKKRGVSPPPVASGTEGEDG